MPMRNKLLKFDIDPYPICYYVGYGASPEYFQRKAKAHGLDVKKDLNGGRTWFDWDKQECWIYTSDKDPSILAHEVFHAAVCTMKFIGVRFCDASEEAYAYLIQNLMYKIMEK